MLLSSLIFFSIFLGSAVSSDTISATKSLADGETLLSSGKTFEIGFFSGGNPKYRYLGIWYKVTPKTVVWVANRNNPLTDFHGVLTISESGNLVLLNRTKGVIWSSDMSKVTAKHPVSVLLDSGNLVLRDNDSTVSTKEYLWQSFDYPCDTILAGMKHGWDSNTGHNRYLTSWKSVDDPSPGDFTYGMDISHGLPQVVLTMGSTRKLYRSGTWNGMRFTGQIVPSDNVFRSSIVIDENESYYMFDSIVDSVVTRLTLNQSGRPQRLILQDGATEWSIMYSLPYEQCDNYGICGANAICGIDDNPVICACLEGFTPASEEEWQVLNWSKGCKKTTPLDCKKGEGFVEVVGVKLPDLLEYRFNKTMSLKECERDCLSNCSCKAFANSDITNGGSGCLMWFGDLIDVRELRVKGSEQNMYIRLSASEMKSITNASKNRRLMIILVVSASMGFCLLGLIIWRIRLWKRKRMIRGNNEDEDIEIPLFDFATIASATDNFSVSQTIGEGGFGPVFKGKLSTGQEVAVKRLSKNSWQGLTEFKNEVELIAKLQHRNLVALHGCCIQGEERMLIYEFMPNKSLDHHIFDNKSMILPWKKHFDIVKGIARGLLYLHRDSKLHIIHRDLKASNILLDNNLNPKISDFGLARIFGDDEEESRTRRVIGTYGYMSPEYAVDGKFSVKSDIFSFGVLLLEIVSRKRNRRFNHPNHHHNLLGHAWLLWNEGEALDVMDAYFKDSCVESQVLRCIHIALLCVQKFPCDRPTMSSVVFMLENEGAPLSDQPKQPGFFVERADTVDEGSTSRSEEIYSENMMTITIPNAR